MSSALERLQRQLGNGAKRKFNAISGKEQVAQRSIKINEKRELILSILCFIPVQIVRLILEFERELCIYWPSVGARGPLRVWQWSVESTAWNPTCIAISEHKNFNHSVEGGQICCAKINNGSFYLLFQIGLSYLYFFDSTTMQLTAIESSSRPWVGRYGTPSMIAKSNKSNNELLVNGYTGYTWSYRHGELTAVEQMSFTDRDRDHEWEMRRSTETWLYFSGGYQSAKATKFKESDRALNGDLRHSEVFVLKLDRHNKILSPWKKIESLALPVGLHATCAANGALVVSGGLTGVTFAFDNLSFISATGTNACFFYHPEFNRWIKLPDLPTPQVNHTMIFIDQKLMVFNAQFNRDPSFSHVWSFSFTPQRMQEISGAKSGTPSVDLGQYSWLYHSEYHRIARMHGTSKIIVHPLSSNSLIACIAKPIDDRNYPKLDSHPKKPRQFIRLNNHTWSNVLF